MPLSRQDKDYLLPDITPINPTIVDIDRVFTNLLPLLKYDGAPITSGKKRRVLVTIKDLASKVCGVDSLHFVGFSEHSQIVSHWLESDFLSLVHRGKEGKQRVAAPLPLHLNTYKLRNPRYCRDYGVADQIFGMLYHGSPDVAKELRDYLFSGADYYTDHYDSETPLDIESLLMMRILDQAAPDYPDAKKKRDIPYPLCIGQARVMGDDISRLLAYRDAVPRLVLIDHIKSVMALHVGIYMLRLFQLVPDLVAREARHSVCSNCPVHGRSPKLFDVCAFPVDLVADMGEDYRQHMSGLGRQQFSTHLGQLNNYVRAHITIKKLQEFADDLVMRGCIARPQTFAQILALRHYDDPMELRTFFGIRIQSLLGTDEGEPDARLVALRRLGLGELETYVEMVYLLRQSFHHKYYTQLLDSLFQKNRKGGLMRQGYGRINKRRYALSSGLMETLVQMALLQRETDGSKLTRSIRVEDFIEWIRARYGIYVGSLPGGHEYSITDLGALRLNVQHFQDRLREIGYYTDLSDAYVAQVIRPRYHIEQEELV